MGANYATISDMTELGISLTSEQQTAAGVLITQASAKLRLIAKKYDKNVDALIAEDEDYGEAVKSIVIQAVTRALNSITNTDPAATQGSQAALGYSVSYTYLNAGQSLYFLRNELKDLGFMQQTYGAMEVYYDAETSRNNS